MTRMTEKGVLGKNELSDANWLRTSLRNDARWESLLYLPCNEFFFVSFAIYKLMSLFFFLNRNEVFAHFLAGIRARDIRDGICQAVMSTWLCTCNLMFFLLIDSEKLELIVPFARTKHRRNDLTKHGCRSQYCKELIHGHVVLYISQHFCGNDQWKKVSEIFHFSIFLKIFLADSSNLKLFHGFSWFSFKRFYVELDREHFKFPAQ